MAGGSKLASGYIDLTVKYGSAMKKIADDFTSVQGIAEKSGVQSGSRFSSGFKSNAKASADLSGLRATESQSHQFGASAGSKFGTAFKGALAAAGVVAAAAGIAKAVKETFDTGLDFEKTANKLQAVTSATAQQMGQLRREARALGNDVSLTGANASDAMQAMTELAKAGFSVDDAMTAARGTLQLASAAQISAAQAAEIQSNALLAFGRSAADAGTAADVLANAANASSAEITDVAYAFQMGSSVASQFGISMEDTATAIAVFANAGIKGSDAGTLLKSMLLALASPSDPAAGAIKELGLTVWDADGKFVGLSQTMDELQKASKRMTPEMYTYATSTAFGSDAARVAGIAARQGAQGFNEMHTAITRQGAAAQVAAAQTQGMPGVMERLSNTAESAKLELFDLVDGPLAQLGDELNTSLSGAVNWFSSHKPEIIDFFVAVGDAAIGVLSQVQSFVASAIKDFGMMAGAVGDVAGAMGAFDRWISKIPGMGDSTAEAERLEKIAEKLHSFETASADSAKKVEENRKVWDDWKATLNKVGDQAANNERILRALGDGFKEVNDKGEIVLKDNTPEVTERLKELGISVTTLPEGTVELKPNTPAAQQVINDFIKSNNPTVPLVAPVTVDLVDAQNQMTAFFQANGLGAGGSFTLGVNGGIGGSLGGGAAGPRGYQPGVGGPSGLQPGFGVPGTAGKGYMNSAAASAWLDARGASYGLPSGTNTGGYGTGTGDTFPGWVMQVARAFGISPSTYAGHQESDRNEPGYAPNPNHQNRGIDWTGPVENLQKFADYLAQMPQALEQVIWENPYTHAKTGIGGGQINPGYYPQSTYDQHGGNDPGNIHVHTRQSAPIPLPFMTYDSGGVLPPGVTIANNETGQDEFTLTEDQLNAVKGSGIDTSQITGSELAVDDWIRMNGGKAISPDNKTHGRGKGQLPGPTDTQLEMATQLGIAPRGSRPAADGSDWSSPGRTQGYIPAGAGNSSVAGTSFLSGLYGMGAEVINGVIDQGAALASTAATAAIAAGTMGAGAAGAPAAGAAAQFAIGIGTQAAKRGVQYGAQMLGIGTDALLEQLSPFGMPRWLTTDVTGFMPQQGIMQAATTSIEKAFQQGNQPPQGPGTDPVPGMPGQQHGIPGQPGTSPLGPPPGPPQPAPGSPTQPPTPPPGMPQQPQDLLSYFGIPAVYDEGGWLEPGGIAINKTKSVEPMAVFNDSQWDTMSAIANAPVAAPDPKAMGGAGDDYSVHIHSVTVKDVAELERQMKDRQTLQTMRYRGRPSSG